MSLLQSSVPSWFRRAVRPLRPRWRREQANLAKEYRAFLCGLGPELKAVLGAYPAKRIALVVGYDTVKLASYQTPVLCALRMAGYRTIILVSSGRGATADFYKTLGASAVVGTEEVGSPVLSDLVREIASSVKTQADVIGLHYRGIAIGRFVVSTLMRRLRRGSIDPLSADVVQPLHQAIAASLRAVDIAQHVVARYRPALVSFIDRGYTPDGELFEVALAAGAKAFTLNGAHRGGLIMSKRYGAANKDRHFAAPSSETWDKLRDMPWGDTQWHALRDEIEKSYRSGTWYDEVGTQFNKKVMARENVVNALGIDPAKRTAVIFPHLFWDATFFWGEDLFADYNEWFCEALKCAAANDRLNWVVKIHPAGLVKDIRDGYRGESSESIAIRETLGTLPSHIKLIPSDSPISTFSLFDVMDYCLTVRGTIGIEMAAFGATVVTAGTGRYDGFGFTVDPRSRAEYIELLSKLETLPPPSGHQVELARRYAYGLFLARPLALESIRFHYLKDAAASMQIELGIEPSQPLDTVRDLRILSAWLGNDRQEDLIGVDIETASVLASASS